ncbi:uncharacterized protein BDZ83DRAFT_638627 [Colletotrichum acutatum]|uniref:Secreted protein n=1 Tax=Glomerella acutata TaxID=27357 RepID=A0AAD8UAH6_GLOAC|nr:uncharacterized protein BDZ83DRAFT_638627 [Colletotrichum acutatum]KAK1712284.1 hypothetical protein BDZ83DRAFT_638627 [Colletotrichum acutatum]
MFLGWISSLAGYYWLASSQPPQFWVAAGGVFRSASRVFDRTNTKQSRPYCQFQVGTHCKYSQATSSRQKVLDVQQAG